METVIVDGDNVLHNWLQFKEDIRKGIKHARSNLVKELSAYRAASGNEVILLFNASLSDPKGVDRSPESGLRIIFARNGQEVLLTIKRLVRESKDPTSILVATADDKLGNYVQKRGARRMTDFKFRQANRRLLKRRQVKETRRQRPRYGVTLAQILDRESLDALKELRASLKK